MSDKSIDSIINQNQADEPDQSFILEPLHEMDNIRNVSLEILGFSRSSRMLYERKAELLAQAIMLKNPAAANQIHMIAQMMDQHVGLVGYDAMQRGYWKRKCPAFIDALDTLTIQTLGPYLSAEDQTHHLFQAAKHQISRGLPTAAMQKALRRTIVPYNGAVETVGEPWTLVHPSGIDVTAKANRRNVVINAGDASDHILRALDQSRDCGYMSAVLESPEGITQELRESYPEIHEDGGKIEIILHSRRKRQFDPQAQLMGIASDPCIIDAVSSMERRKIKQLAGNFSPDSFRSAVYSALEGRFPDIDTTRLDEDPVEGIKGTLHRLLNERMRMPDTYGFAVGDPVIINHRINEGDNMEEYWEGSHGVVVKVEPNRTVMFDNVVIGGKKEQGRTIYWDIEPEHLKVIEKSAIRFPDWYRAGPVPIGSRVELKKSYWDDYEKTQRQPDTGSTGKVLGPTYSVRFHTLVSKRGKIRKGMNETVDEMTGEYFSRKGEASREEIGDIIDSVFVDALALKGTNLPSDLQYEPIVVKTPTCITIDHRQDMGDFQKGITLVIDLGGNKIPALVTYISKRYQQPSEAGDYAEAARAAVSPIGSVRFTGLRSAFSQHAVMEIMDHAICGENHQHSSINYCSIHIPKNNKLQLVMEYRR